MPRDGSGVYSLTPGYSASPNTTIQSGAQHNTPFADLVQDANTPRPVVAGGTGRATLTDFKADLGIADLAKATGAELKALANDTHFVTPKAVADAMAFATFAANALDLSILINGKITLAANTTFAAPTNYGKEGQEGVLEITQDATGGRTGSFNTAYDFGPIGTPTLSTAPGAIDRIYYRVKAGAAGLFCQFVSATTVPGTISETLLSTVSLNGVTSTTVTVPAGYSRIRLRLLSMVASGANTPRLAWSSDGSTYTTNQTLTGAALGAGAGLSGEVDLLMVGETTGRTIRPALKVDGTTTIYDATQVPATDSSGIVTNVRFTTTLAPTSGVLKILGVK